MAQYLLDQQHPHLISFEITKNCNYKCVFCYQADRITNKEKDVPRSDVKRGITPPRLQPEMTLDEIRQHLIPQVGELEFKAFCFLGAEPLLRLDDILALAPDFKKHTSVTDVQISTNGYLLDEKKVDELCRAYRDFFLTIAIPLDSTDPETVRELRPPKADVYDRSIAALKLVFKKGLFIDSEMVVTRKNLDQMDKVGNLLRKIGGMWSFQEVYPMFNAGRALEHDDLALSKEELKVVDTYKIEHYGKPVVMWDCMPLPIGDETWNKVKKRALATSMSRGCSAGNNYYNVDHAGNIYPCNFLGDFHLGNVMDGPHVFRDVWNTNPLVLSMRNRNIGGKCSTCKYKINCGGCRSRAYMETGDVLGGVESCDGGPDGHPMEKTMAQNVLRAYRKYMPIARIYRVLKKLRILK
jgi:radical SAM protein with 4Fe4S-binding SPASM domain